MSSLITYGLAVVTLFIFFIYISVAKGIVGLLGSLAVFLIATSFVESMEYVTSLVVIVGLAYVTYSNTMEAFNDANTGEAIVQRVHGFEKAYGKGKPITIQAVGSEGFEDAAELKQEENTGDIPSRAPSTDSEAAPRNEVVKIKDIDREAEKVKGNIKKEEEKADKDKIQTAPVGQPNSVEKDSPANKAETISGFDGAKGLFKLGEMPSETKSGPFVDVAATMGQAIGALQPEQMAAMTQESQKLMETQKSLMGMLQSMRPVLQDGRQLLDTFSGIFGSSGGGKGLGGMLPQMDKNAGKA